jgi:hypothetical protein
MSLGVCMVKKTSPFFLPWAMCFRRRCFLALVGAVYSVEFPVVDFLFLLSNIASQALGRAVFLFFS